jgi:5-methylcytosine-specific restriction endonuclease McrA
MHPVVIANRRVKDKRCRDCKRFRFPTACWFHRDRNRPDGFQLYCKDCKRERDSRSYIRHREKRQRTFRTWKRQHREEIDAWHRRYVKEYRRGQRRRTTLSDDVANLPERYRLHKLCSSCGGSFPPADFPGRRPECRRCGNRRQPRYRNPTKRAVYRQNRRARETGQITPAEWRVILDHWQHRCAYCRAVGPLTMDHVVPLAKGGRHAADNLVPACPSCNSGKHTKTWRPGGPRE